MGVTQRGFDAPGESVTSPGTSALNARQATQNPTHASEPDAFVAFVACLTAEQRVKLAALLLGDPAGTAGPPGDADRAGRG